MTPYRHILAPTHFSTHCHASVARAADLAQRYDAHLTLLHVIDYFPEELPNDWIPPEDQDPKGFLVARAQERLDRLAEELMLGEVRKEVRLSDRSARHEISDFAATEAVDLIVLASHARHGIFSLLGSTAGGVVHTAPCDVTLVRACVE